MWGGGIICAPRAKHQNVPIFVCEEMQGHHQEICDVGMLDLGIIIRKKNWLIFSGDH